LRPLISTCDKGKVPTQVCGEHQTLPTTGKGEHKISLCWTVHYVRRRTAVE